MTALPYRKGYATAEEARHSKAYTSNPGAVLYENCSCGRVHVVTGLRARAVLPRARRLRPVSAARAAENRVRRAMARAMFPGGTPLCAVPWCGGFADDLHEPLSRARGGSITDPENAVPLCRKHHDMITFRPESELGWAYDLGLLRHSWGGGAA